nr:ribosome maturation factor RimP [Hyella patelloides]
MTRFFYCLSLVLHYNQLLTITEVKVKQFNCDRTIDLVVAKLNNFRTPIRNLFKYMTHPLIPQIVDLASPIAEKLNLELVDVVFQTNKNPPVLRIDVRNLLQDTGLEDCEQMSRDLETQLDATGVIPSAYVLEVSSPGISHTLTSDREFISFKGFAVIVKTAEPYKKRTQWEGTLQGRDENAVYIHQKGKKTAIPRNLVKIVQFDDQS